MSGPVGHSTRSPHPQSLDTVIASDTSISPSSYDSSLPMPPHSRLRLLRRTEHLLPSMFSRSPPLSPPSQHRRSTAMSSRSISQIIEDATPHVEAASPFPSTTAPPSPPITDQPQPSEASGRLHPLRDHPSARIDWFQDIRDNFDPFEPFSLDQQQDPPSSFYSQQSDTERSGQLPRPTPSPFMARQRSVRPIVDR
jgi:hypothetical protein